MLGFSFCARTPTLDHLRASEDPGLNKDIFRIALDHSYLDKPQREMQSGILLQEVRHGLHAFVNAIADQKQEKPPLAQIANDRINEGGFLTRGEVTAGASVQRLILSDSRCGRGFQECGFKIN